MSAATILVLVVATVGLAVGELYVFWRLGGHAERRQPAHRSIRSRLIRGPRQKAVRQRLHRRSL
jgi:hypothetical protein